MVGTKAKLVEDGDGEHGEHGELGKVSQGWLKMVAIGKLESMPSLDSGIKNHACKHGFVSASQTF